MCRSLLSNEMNYCYRPQRSCGKAMFLYLSVSHSVDRGGLCPSMHHRSHDWGVSAQGGLCPGGSLSRGGLCQGDPPGERPPPRERLPCTVTSGRYASYRNAFLFIRKFLCNIFCRHQTTTLAPVHHSGIYLQHISYKRTFS